MHLVDDKLTLIQVYLRTYLPDERNFVNPINYYHQFAKMYSRENSTHATKLNLKN